MSNDPNVQLEPRAASDAIYFVCVRDSAYVYPDSAISSNLTRAQNGGFSNTTAVGSIVTCGNLGALSNTYTQFTSRFVTPLINQGMQFVDLNATKIQFQVGANTRQVLTKCTMLNGTSVNSTGGATVWVPTFCCFNAVSHPLFDSVHVARTG